MRIRASITEKLRSVISVIIVLLPIASSAWAVEAAPLVPELVSDSRTATAGFYHLKWQGNGLLASSYELQEASDAGFTQPTTIYRGPDQATLISGRKNGQYFYRVRALDQGQPTSPWSSPVAVTVRHHPPARAFAFFAAGAVVFLATLVLIISGARHSQKERAK
ncbi:conserved hypothetical protein [Nitrosococcus halophilus Nc 4]|uniref:Fibronectin type-III domain-containing protein n=1 Tax=Nitrosococcus halophilus (strain Nc4) TaxID=472759 RepID=D5C594_NITHN|nr:hypothetical protein [Nitrosococcus halophilus]ADE15317.1 conserved hypothetical protein [Nitrosococcus halophilus Nc 4]